MNLQTYYSPLINFFNDLKNEYKTNESIKVLDNPNNFQDANEIKFVSEDPKLFTFSVTFWTDDYFPRVGLYIKHPNKEEYYEAIDLYEGGKDIDIQDLMSYIRAILSNEFVFEYKFLKGKEISVSYRYTTISKDEIKLKRDFFKKKFFILPWHQKKITTKIYTYQPWIGNKIIL